MSIASEHRDGRNQLSKTVKDEGLKFSVEFENGETLGHTDQNKSVTSKQTTKTTTTTTTTKTVTKSGTNGTTETRNVEKRKEVTTENDREKVARTDNHKDATEDRTTTKLPDINDSRNQQNQQQQKQQQQWQQHNQQQQQQRRAQPPRQPLYQQPKSKHQQEHNRTSGMYHFLIVEVVVDVRTRRSVETRGYNKY